MSQRVRAKVCKLSLCECGFHVLRDEIGIGAEYTIYPDSIEKGWTFICGGCGAMLKVAVVLADQTEGKPRRPLPLDIFDYPNSAQV
jgi:hypothetical protein